MRSALRQGVRPPALAALAMRSVSSCLGIVLWHPYAAGVTVHGMVVAALHRYSFTDYLDLEQASNVRHEYLQGEIYAMAGGTPRHAALAVAVSSALFVQLRGGHCRVFSSDLRVRVLATGLAAYPDVTVVCGPLEHDPASGTTVVNPTLLVEVLSPGTAEYDRGEKLDHYQRIPSLQAVLLVSDGDPAFDLWSNAAGKWTVQHHRPGSRVELPTLGCTLEVDAIYQGAPPP